MKKLTTSILLAVALLFNGCATMKNPTTLTAIARGAAFSGTSLWLNTHPGDRDKFVMAQQSLKALIASGSGSPVDLQTALSALPIAQLSGPNGSLIVQDAVVIIDAAGAEIATLDTKQVWSSYVLPVATGALQGLNNALGVQLHRK